MPSCSLAASAHKLCLRAIWLERLSPKRDLFTCIPQCSRHTYPSHLHLPSIPRLDAPCAHSLYSLLLPQLALDYSMPHLTAKTAVSLTASPKVDVALTSGYDKVTVGGETSYDAAKGALTKVSKGCGGVGQEWQVQGPRLRVWNGATSRQGRVAKVRKVQGWRSARGGRGNAGGTPRYGGQRRAGLVCDPVSCVCLWGRSSNAAQKEWEGCGSSMRPQLGGLLAWGCPRCSQLWELLGKGGNVCEGWRGVGGTG